MNGCLSEKICLTCVSGIYCAIYGHMNMVFTQSIDEACLVAQQLGIHNDNPQWYAYAIPITENNMYNVVDTIDHFKHVLGNGYSEFISVQEKGGQHTLVVQGFTI